MKDSTFHATQYVLCFFIAACIAAAVHCGIKFQECNNTVDDFPTAIEIQDYPNPSRDAFESEWVDGETSDERANFEQCQVCGAIHQVNACPLEAAE